MIRQLIGSCVLAVSSLATTLTGTLNGPDGTGANGTLYFALSQPGALSAAGGCGGPVSLLPTIQVAIKVTAGAMVSPPSIYGNDCILPQGTFYAITFKDNNGNTLFTDRWIITGSSIDIGTIVSVVITGTTGFLGQAGIVLTNPAGNQTVTQPSGTSLTVSDITVSNGIAGPGGFACGVSAAQCTFGVAVAFTNGFGTSAGSDSTLYINNGNMYIRHPAGAITCASVGDGWFGVRTDTLEFVTCIGGAVYSVPLVLGQ